MSGGQQEALVQKEDLGESVVTTPPPYSAQVQVKDGRSMPVDPSLSTIYLSVFAMLFCFWPCALVGLIYGIQGMQEYYRGQYDQSAKTGKKAKRWVIASVASGITFTVLVIGGVLLAHAVTWGVIYGRDGYDDDDRKG